MQMLQKLEKGEKIMKIYKTVMSAVTMVIFAVIGLFVGAASDNALGGSILFALIAGITCIVNAIENFYE